MQLNTQNPGTLNDKYSYTYYLLRFVQMKVILSNGRHLRHFFDFIYAFLATLFWQTATIMTFFPHTISCVCMYNRSAVSAKSLLIAAGSYCVAAA